MISRSEVEKNLRTLDSMFRNAPSQKKALFYSKLAILELCGWTEESMDDIVLRCSVRCLKNQTNRDYIASDVVKRNYGFEYDRHFRGMLIRLLGVIAVERIEAKVDPLKASRLKAALGTLKVSRNREAHTHVKGVLRRIDAPSVTLNHFLVVYDGLKEYDLLLRQWRVVLKKWR